ncbi:uncharacterized protein LOC130625941 [Hydractinia symbiolongicarpus]|uniref:uncharacterized protein LOC130625941 n=1 Tax=Hydractinia symbiolongicarpus TaxID=13093 RepID=UPI00254F4EA2|nr:uncharacterized protein LOC130625941 [Hydractinia symbiolongicarpus]
MKKLMLASLLFILCCNHSINGLASGFQLGKSKRHKAQGRDKIIEFCSWNPKFCRMLVQKAYATIPTTSTAKSRRATTKSKLFKTTSTLFATKSKLLSTKSRLFTTKSK